MPLRRRLSRGINSLFAFAACILPPTRTWRHLVTERRKQRRRLLCLPEEHFQTLPNRISPRVRAAPRDGCAVCPSPHYPPGLLTVPHGRFMLSLFERHDNLFAGSPLRRERLSALRVSGKSVVETDVVVVGGGLDGSFYARYHDGTSASLPFPILYVAPRNISHTCRWRLMRSPPFAFRPGVSAPQHAQTCAARLVVWRGTWYAGLRGDRRGVPYVIPNIHMRYRAPADKNGFFSIYTSHKFISRGTKTV